MNYSSIDKAPGATIDYTFEWGDHIGDDAVNTASFDVPAGITATLQGPITNETVTVRVAGGTAGQGYRIGHSIVTDAGQIFKWELMVNVTPSGLIPVGPPFATIEEAQEYQPGAQGASALKVEMVLQDASDIVQFIAPEPEPKGDVKLTANIDAVQDKIQVDEPIRLYDDGTILVDSEIIFYRDRTMGLYSIASSGFELKRCQRGRMGTVPASHSLGALVQDVGYPLKARRAELAVFEWLWDTRGYIPGKTGVVGSASFSIGDEVFQMVRRIFRSQNGVIRGTVPIGSFRRRRSPSDIQRGSYNL